MQNDNVFDLLVEVTFAKSPQLGCILPNSQVCVKIFQLIEGESLQEIYHGLIKYVPFGFYAHYDYIKYVWVEIFCRYHTILHKHA